MSILSKRQCACRSRFRSFSSLREQNAILFFFPNWLRKCDCLQKKKRNASRKSIKEERTRWAVGHHSGREVNRHSKAHSGFLGVFRELCNQQLIPNEKTSVALKRHTLVLEERVPKWGLSFLQIERGSAFISVCGAGICGFSRQTVSTGPTRASSICGTLRTESFRKAGVSDLRFVLHSEQQNFAIHTCLSLSIRFHQGKWPTLSHSCGYIDSVYVFPFHGPWVLGGVLLAFSRQNFMCSSACPKSLSISHLLPKSLEEQISLCPLEQPIPTSQG